MNEKLEAYKEICDNIRETDRISFQLLGFVLSITTLVAGFLAFIQAGDLLQTSGQILSLTVVLLSCLGALIVFGFFRWEMRNIEKCNSLIKSAAELEDGSFGKQYKNWLSDGKQTGWGKTECERLIYRAAIALWLVPIIVALARVSRDLA